MRFKSKQKENEKQILTCKELRVLLMEGQSIPLPRTTLKSKIKYWLIKKIKDF